jgi:hypothetical protein
MPYGYPSSMWAVRCASATVANGVAVASWLVGLSDGEFGRTYLSINETCAASRRRRFPLNRSGLGGPVGGNGRAQHRVRVVAYVV